MSIRWKRWAAMGAGLVAAYAAIGFWAVPAVAKRQLTAYAHDSLQRQASVRELSFNPFTLRLRASDLALAEADGAPLFAIGQLTADLRWLSLVTGAWRFGEIEVDRPTASLVIAPDGRFNIAELLAAARKGSTPSADASLPRLAIGRFAMTGGRVDMQDRHAGYSNTLAPIDFEVTGFSTLPDRTDDYVFSAQTQSGATLRWKGRSSVNPIRASGEFALDNASLPELSVYLRSKVRATVAAGKLSATLPYSFAYADGKFDAQLQGAKIGARDLAFAREGASDSFATLTQLTAEGIDADLAKLDVRVREVRAAKGRLDVRRDAKGNLDLAQLMVQAAGPAAAPTKGKAVQALEWKAAVSKVVLDGVAVSVVDETVSPPLKVGAGAVGAQFSLQAAQRGDTLDVKVGDASLALADVAAAKGSQAQKLARAGFEGGSLDLAARHAEVARVFAEGGQFQVVRDRAGAIELATWAPRTPAPAAKAERKTADAPWTAVARIVELAKLDAELADEASGVKVHLVGAHARLGGAGTDMLQAVKFDAGFSVREGGQFAGSGTIVPATAAVKAQVKATKIALGPIQPLLAQYLKLRIGGGTLTAQGAVATGAGNAKDPVARYDGSFNVDGVVIRELDNDVFASWRSIGAARLTASVSPNRLDIPELRIAGADAKLMIEEDRSFNAMRLLVNPPAANAAAASPEPAAAPGPETFPVRIRRVRIQDAKLDFTDLSLRPQFAAKIHELNGVINGLSTSPTARAQIELDGRVDEFGMARIRGETSLAAPKDNTDVNFVFRNVDMVPASPYSMKFAGYRIAEGKISLDLQYKIRGSKLEGDNRIVIDKLTLGERVDSPDAMKIPLQLAIAVLKDSDGRIDLGLPVSGDLNDPQFSYGAIIWKAITNVLTKIVTAPFRALGAMLGVDGTKLEAIDFDAGGAKLQPPEREKLKQVAQILAKRESLKLSVPGQYSPTADGAALRARAVRMAVAQQAGIKLAAGEEPGPLDFGDRSIRSALREVYSKRFGDGELDKAKKAAESAAAAGPARTASAPPQSNLPMWQRAAKMIQGEPQVADASAFYNHLRERLEREQPLPADALKQLGEERAKAIAAALAETGVDPARFAVAGAEAADSPAGKTVALKLALAPR